MIFSGSDLRTARENLGVSLDTLAQIAGISLSTISRWEIGAREPTEASIRSVYSALTNLQNLKLAFDPVPIDLSVVAWVREQIDKMTAGRNGALIRAAGQSAELLDVVSAIRKARAAAKLPKGRRLS